MSEKHAYVLDENFPFPLRSICLIAQHSRWWMGKSQIPEPENEELHKAHNAVAAWLMILHREFGYPGTEDDPTVELHPQQANLGVCPECHTNDGFLVVGDNVSAVCHRHRVRWQVSGREIGWLTQSHSTRLSWEDHDRVLAYAQISPAWLPGFSPAPEPPLRAAGHLRQVETETFTQGMARMFHPGSKLPTGPFIKARFWRPPAELVEAALKAVMDAERSG